MELKTQTMRGNERKDVIWLNLDESGNKLRDWQRNQKLRTGATRARVEISCKEGPTTERKKTARDSSRKKIIKGAELSGRRPEVWTFSKRLGRVIWQGWRGKK